ncbi:MAG: DUF4340 domain-containing protein [Micropepsaceae bacterium]
MNTSTKAPLVPVLQRRVRALTYLGGATAATVLFALLSQWQRGASETPDFKPVKMFPALEARANDVAGIQIESKTSTFNVVRTADGKWILPDKGKYGADFNEIRKTITGLADLDLVEQRTARADWAEKLGLGAPTASHEGQGTVVTLKDAKGDVLASIVVGNAVEGASAGGKQAIYVRRPQESQTYVARGGFEAATDQTQWLDKSFIDFPSDRIKTVSMKPLKGPTYSVARATPSTQNFAVVERLPSGRSLRTEAEPNGVGNALIGMTFTDVVPQSQVDFSKSARATFQTFDGMALNVMIAEKDNDFWVSFDAVEVPPTEVAPASSPSGLKPNIAKEVEELNAMSKGWAYKVPRYKGTLLTSPLEALLNVVGSKVPTGPGGR